jgi:uncharacterized protein RhaS with RHS repeats
MRFLQNDPIGFDAGDANTYRYEGNDPTRRLDPSGMDSQWTESSALQQLKGQIQEWREKKFNFAANLLQHFIDKKGPAQYVFVESRYCRSQGARGTTR